mmetsp:Transcript_4106/g.4662  ORF Transcript_4106/g.4662 Transcript_4106/m.4662 type:complete len:130 (+) Transcript_4106:132-521(+)
MISRFQQLLLIFKTMSLHYQIATVFYVILFLITFGAISSTLSQYPLFPFNWSSLDWSNAWLSATVIDYYGACLSLCGIIIFSESRWQVGLAWSLGCCLLGSPICCSWILWKIWNGHTLSLAPRSGHVAL